MNKPDATHLLDIVDLVLTKLLDSRDLKSLKYVHDAAGFHYQQCEEYEKGPRQMELF
jgi:hypothetical protein